MGEPKTLEEARKYRYGVWGGLPQGHAYREGYCAFQVFPSERGEMHHQCTRRNGHGLNKLFCRQHSKWSPGV